MMKCKVEYIALPGFEDLRNYKIPQKEFVAFVRIQRFLYGWEQKRRAGAIVPVEVREASAQYQECLRQYPQMKEKWSCWLLQSRSTPLQDRP